MAIEIKLTLPIPPSTNSCFTNMERSGGKRRSLTKPARNYKAYTKLYTLSEARKQDWHYEGRQVAVSILFWFPDKRRRDLANFEKLLIDAISEELGFDDSVIDRLELSRQAVDKDEPHCIVWVTQI